MSLRNLFFLANLPGDLIHISGTEGAVDGEEAGIHANDWLCITSTELDNHQE